MHFFSWWDIAVKHRVAKKGKNVLITFFHYKIPFPLPFALPYSPKDHCKMTWSHNGLFRGLISSLFEEKHGRLFLTFIHIWKMWMWSVVLWGMSTPETQGWKEKQLLNIKWEALHWPLLDRYVLATSCLQLGSGPSWGLCLLQHRWLWSLLTPEERETRMCFSSRIPSAPSLAWPCPSLKCLQRNRRGCMPPVLVGCWLG